jgi:mono/diheme cytochrome c family protein
MKVKLALGAAVMVIGAGIYFYLMFTGPRMIDQPNIRAFQAPMPAAPADSVPVESAWPRPPRTPPPASPQIVAAGKVYYGYYCIQCHGAKGDGFGPVGESFVPFPADLRSPRVQRMSDEQLLKAMVSGPGHTPAPPFATTRPALDAIVIPDQRWPIVYYVRQFAPAK